MRRLRPPIFWKHKDRFKVQAEAWPGAQLARGLRRLLETEADCKRTGSPAQAVAARVLLEIAANAPTRRR